MYHVIYSDIHKPYHNSYTLFVNYWGHYPLTPHNGNKFVLWWASGVGVEVGIRVGIGVGELALVLVFKLDPLPIESQIQEYLK